VYYIDVSHHDWSRKGGNLDWAKIRQATSPVMCARATYGDPGGLHYHTRHFPDFQRAAKAAGFDVRGGYHNLVSGDQASINRQVDWLRRELDAHGCVWAMLDVERYAELVANNRWPRWEHVRQFVTRWKQVDQRVLAVYLPRWIWAGYLGKPDLRVLDCPIVASDYGSNVAGAPAAVYASRGGDNGRGWEPYGGVTPAIWQFGSRLTVPGASSTTDVNAYRGPLEQLKALLLGGTPTTPKGSEMSTTPTDVAVGDILRLLEQGLRGRGRAETHGGGIPIAWIVRVIKEIQDKLDALAGKSPTPPSAPGGGQVRSEEHTSELQSRENLVCRLL